MAERHREKTKVCPTCNKVFDDESVDCPDDGSRLDQIAAGAKADPLIGQVFADKYEIISVLGEGGMSIVYKARHRYMDRIVAIKLLHEHLVSDRNAVTRFEHESKASSSLNHQNIVAVHDFGVTRTGQAYFVMDCLDGRSLGEILEKQGKLPLAEAIVIFKQTCEGLEHAHKKRVVHRDLKPSNLVLMKNEDGSMLVKIVDFGIAKLLPIDGVSRQSITVTGEIFGSPLYMSPEQCSGQSLDQRSDIYSLGCLMYETLTGVPPIMGESFVNTVVKHINEAPPSFKSVDPELKIPAQIEACIMKCLAKRPEDRYQSASEVRQSLLDAALEGGVEGFRPGAVAVTLKKPSFLSQTFERVKLSGNSSVPSMKQSHSANKNLLALSLGTILLGAGAILTLALWPGPQGDRGPGYLRLIFQWQISQAQQALESKHYDDAINLLASAKDSAESFQDGHKRLLDTLALQSEAFGKAGKFAEQEACNQEILAINKKLVLEEVAQCEKLLSNLRKVSDSSVTNTMNQLEAEANADKILLCAKKLLARSLFPEAETLLKHAIVTFDKLNLDSHQKTADFKAELAECLILRQHLAEARPLLLEALKIREQSSEAQNPLALRALIKAQLRLGQFDRDRSNFKESSDELQKALRLAEEKLPQDRELMAEALNSYADLLRQQGDSEGAALYRERAEAVSKNTIMQATELKEAQPVK